MAGTLLVLSLAIHSVLGSPANEGAALRSAASSGDLQELKRLLDRGADIEAQNNYPAYGWTALHWAADNNHLDVVKELLDRGADIDAQEDNGRTALHWAVENYNLDVVKELVHRGANVLTKATYGTSTALELAREKGELCELCYTEIERILEMAEDQQSKVSVLSGSNAGISCVTAHNPTILVTLCAISQFLKL